jgi:hypothetical protein
MSLVNAVQPVHPAEVQRDMLDEQNPATGLRLSLQLGTTRGGVKFLPTFPSETARLLPQTTFPEF